MLGRHKVSNARTGTRRERGEENEKTVREGEKTGRGGGGGGEGREKGGGGVNGVKERNTFTCAHARTYQRERERE